MISQEKQILKFLQAGNKLTSLGALKLCQSWRLSGRIKNLRNKGYNIHTEMITVNEKRIAEYSLNYQTKLAL